MIKKFLNKFNKTFLISVFNTVLGVGLNRVIVLLTTIFIANDIGDQLFGEFGILKNTNDTFSLISLLGFSVTAIYFISKNENKVKLGLIIVNILGLVTMASLLVIFLMLFFNFEILTYLKAGHLRNEYILFVISIFFVTTSNGIKGVLAGYRAFSAIRNIYIISGIFYLLAFSFVYISEYSSVIAYSNAFLIQSIFSFVISFIFLIRENNKMAIKLIFKISLVLIPGLIKYSFPAFLAAILTTPSTWLVNSFLVRQENGFIEFGYYNVGNQWSSFILLITENIAFVFLPFLIGSKDLDEFKTKIWNTLYLNIALSTLISGILILFANFILSLYGQGFSNGLLIFQFRILSTILTSVNAIFVKSFASKGYMWENFRINLIVSLILVLSAYFFVDQFKGLGLVYAYLISYSFEIMTRGYYSKRKNIL